MKKAMSMSQPAIVALTKRFEGLRLCVYPDPGTGKSPWTAGYGHTGPDVVPGMKVTQKMADAWLSKDLQEAEASVCRLAETDLTQHEFDALVDFEFNTGKLASSTLLAKVNARNFAAARREFDRWVFAHGKVLEGLVARRNAEEDWFNAPD